ncbi:MAG: TolC family protein [Limnochordales bacterium]
MIRQAAHGLRASGAAHRSGAVTGRLAAWGRAARQGAALRGLVGIVLPALLGLALLYPGVALAQEQAMAQDELVYDAVRVVQRALTHHLGVRAAQLQYLLGQARAEETRASLRPALSVEGGPYRMWREGSTPSPELAALLVKLDPEKPQDKALAEILKQMHQPEVTATGYRVAFNFRAPLWRSALQQALAALADAESDQARGDLESALGGVIVQSLEAYYGVLRAEAAWRVALAAYREAEARAEERAAQVASGTATEADRLQAEAERLRAQAELIRAEGELKAARMGLNQSLGYPLDAALTVVETEIPAVWPSLEEALALATERGDVQKARRDLERARAAQVMAEEQAKPGLQLAGRYRWSDAEISLGIDRHGYVGGTASTSRSYKDGGEALPSGETPNWSVGLEVRWPLADGGQTRAQLEQAALQVELAALQLEQMEQSVRAEVTAAHARLMAAAAALEGARNGVAAARQGLAIAQELRTAGAATEADVLRAETALARAEQARLEARYMLTLAQAAYLQAAGVLVPTYLGILADLGVDVELDAILINL